MEILVSAAIISVLAALAFPAMAGAQARGQAAQCLNNLRQLGGAAFSYAADHDMTLPVTVHQKKQGGKSWTITLQEYASGKVTFRCPRDENRVRAYTYVMNDYLTPNPEGAADLDFSQLIRLQTPAETVLFAEAAKDYANADHYHFAEYHGVAMPETEFKQQVAVERHAGAANYVFADGHVECLPWIKVQERLNAPGSRLLDPTAEKRP